MQVLPKKEKCDFRGKYDLVTFRDLDSYNRFRNISRVKYAPDILFGL